MEFIALSHEINVGACVLILAIGLHLYTIAMSECIKQNLSAISQSCQSKAKTKAEKKLISEQFIEYIEFDSTAKRMINDFLGTYQNYIMVLFIWSLTTVSGALLIIQMQIMQLHDDDNLAMLFISLFEVSYGFGVIFITYDLCNRVNAAHDECNDLIHQLEWYRLPVEFQRTLPCIVHFAQQPVNFEYFGSWPCDRETFIYVIKTVISYFMDFR